MRHLTCKEVILNYLADYLGAGLSPEALVDFERHLEGCAACRAYLATYEETRKATGRAGRAPMPSETKIHLRGFLLQQLANSHF